MWFSCALVLLRLFPFVLVLMKLALSWGLRASLFSFVGSVCFIIVSYSVFVLFRFCFFLSLLICCTACCITSVCCLHKTVLSTRRRPAHPVSALILRPRDTSSVVTKLRHRQLRYTTATRWGWDDSDSTALGSGYFLPPVGVFFALRFFLIICFFALALSPYVFPFLLFVSSFLCLWRTEYVDSVSRYRQSPVTHANHE